MFCPLINDECRNDCVFNNETCEILKVSENLAKIQRQTVNCSYTYEIYSRLDEFVKEK